MLPDESNSYTSSVCDSFLQLDNWVNIEKLFRQIRLQKLFYTYRFDLKCCKIRISSKC